MGFFSSIGKAFKSVFKGILKVFSPILKPLGKLLNSGIGKAIMIGLSVFTLGSAMLAGVGSFSTALTTGGPGSFINAFVEGGKTFVSTLTGIGGKEATKNAASELATEAGNLNVVAGGTPELVGQSGLGGAGSIDSAIGQGGALAEGAAGSMAMGPGPTGDAMTRAVQSGGQAAGQGAMLPEAAGAMGPAAGANTAAEAVEATAMAGGGWLDKAKKAGAGFMDFAKSEGGSNIVGSLIQGAGNYYTEKDRQEFQDRVRRQWGRGMDDAGIRDIRQQGARVGRLDTPNAQDIASVSRDTATTAGGRPHFERAYGAGAGS